LAETITSTRAVNQIAAAAAPGSTCPSARSPTCDIEALKKLLVLEFGPDVNVGNVDPDTALDFEATRTGLGVAGPLPSQLQEPA
jgi:hypothetical protein